MSNKIQITFNGHVDRDIIKNILDAPEPYYIDVINNYNLEAPETTAVNLADLDIDEQEAFQYVIDQASWTLEENAFVWKIEKAVKTFSIFNSYVRDDVSTIGPLTDIPDASPLIVRFEIPGFSSNNFREISLWYNDVFSPSDIALVAEIGITLTGDGSEFTIDNIVDCKVSFSKPSGVTDSYVIEYASNNEIIEP